MKISINQKISALSEDFHNGDLSLTDYRVERRKALEALGRSDFSPKQTKASSKGLIKRVFYGTCCAVLLILVTVIVAKFLM